MKLNNIKQKGKIIRDNLSSPLFILDSFEHPRNLLSWSCFGAVNFWFLSQGDFFASKNRTMAYSANTRKTCPMHTTKYKSTAFKLCDTGASVFTPLKMLTSTKNIVTSSPILPGTTSGRMINETHETMTNMADVR